MNILFLGDSLCAAGRNVNIKKANRSEALGFGWVNMVCAMLQERSNNAQCFNLGLDGQTTFQLKEGINMLLKQPKSPIHKADIIVLQIGINDIWWAGQSIDEFKANLLSVICQLRLNLGDIASSIYLMEPICVPLAMKVPIGSEQIGALQQAWLEVGHKNKCLCIKLQHLIDQAVNSRPDLLYDGIHPTPLANAILAHAFFERFASEQL